MGRGLVQQSRLELLRNLITIVPYVVSTAARFVAEGGRENRKDAGKFSMNGVDRRYCFVSDGLIG